MIRLGWFSPISTKTGIATYSAQVLQEMQAQFPADEVQVIVFHPPLEGKRVEMPCPTIALSDSLLQSDFGALFDLAVYHLGNNSLHHAAIYEALMRHPGLVVLHDHVYQHYLAGVSLQGNHISASYVTLVENAVDGGFQIMKSAGVMRSDNGKVAFVPWESEWATRAPISAPFVDMSLGAVVHSDYARRGLDGGGRDPGDIRTLFMPRPEVEGVAPPALVGGRVRIGCCGHIGPTKGLDQLLNAFIKAPELHNAFQVVIAGFGSDLGYLDSLRRNIAEARLGGVFEIKVNPSDEDYRDVMSDCDVFYNLRYPNTEGASLSLMQQLAHGRPVIAYPTGSFAEMPQDACYFLDRIGDDEALIELLLGIAANPSDVRERGAAARRSVADKTAAEYARQFVAHVRQCLPTFARRTALTQARMRGTLPDPGPDRAWLSGFMTARRDMADFYRDRLLLPHGFDRMTLREKGDFLLANHLNTNVDAETAERIGAALDRLSPIELHDVLGKLLTIVSIASGNETYLARHLQFAALPVCDLPVWRILGLMPASVATYLALHALGAPIDKDRLALLTEAVRSYGFRAAIGNFLSQSAPGLLDGLATTRLMSYFTALPLEEIEVLPKTLPGSEILTHARDRWPAPVLVADRFHTLEDIGIWASAARAQMHVNLDPAKPAQAMSAELGLLYAPGSSGQRVRIWVEEMGSGRSRRTTVTVAPGDTRIQCALALPGFAGPLRIGFETDGTISPAECGMSEDSRELGVLVRSLVFDDTAPFGPEAGADDAARDAAAAPDTNADGQDRASQAAPPLLAPPVQGERQ